MSRQAPAMATSGLAGDAAPLLRLEGLSKTFRIGRWPRVRLVKALVDVDLDVGHREILGLVGESGSGKSTLARIVARLEAPSAGRVILDGQPVPARLSRHALLAYRKKVQMVFQDPFASLNPLRTVGETLARPFVVHGLARRGEVRRQVGRLLEQCGLTPAERFVDRYPHELSGGQRQRVGIARALAVEPRLLLADEPTSMLDVSVRLDIMNLLWDLKESRDLSLLFITHDLAAAHYLCDRVAVLYAGHVVEVGPSEEVIGAPRHPYTQLLRKAAPKPELGLRPERLEAPGEVPDLAAPPPGCPFEPRCPLARPECRQGLPRMVTVGPGHLARCVLLDPGQEGRASRGGGPSYEGSASTRAPSPASRTKS
ncbi:ABC transporter ATP-binding protein [Carboxydochorda subterranea]|uniref:ABC transporter ATP-binding protein n=1 Tax=Carboxydichorda subterranea TaxID=3109565 RepID=A0ABZ1C1H2_9FIRM|nr:ABC transporter ATP-binding protein [Limnochorda sp. L945t]WRP18148.1 ABC transporter ATP-binding protein [Limnochorda sp. L945t]